jgi:hypothetical protein
MVRSMNAKLITNPARLLALMYVNLNAPNFAKQFLMAVVTVNNAVNEKLVPFLPSNPYTCQVRKR